MTYIYELDINVHSKIVYIFRNVSFKNMHKHGQCLCHFSLVYNVGFQSILQNPVLQ